MALYSKKKTQVNAVQIKSTDFNGKSWDGSPFSDFPEWLERFVREGLITVNTEGSTDYCNWNVQTTDGVVVAKPGCWIVLGDEETPYVCPDSIFKSLYEKVEDNTPASTDNKSELYELVKILLIKYDWSIAELNLIPAIAEKLLKDTQSKG